MLQEPSKLLPSMNPNAIRALGLVLLGVLTHILFIVFFDNGSLWLLGVFVGLVLSLFIFENYSWVAFFTILAVPFEQINLLEQTALPFFLSLSRIFLPIFLGVWVLRALLNSREKSMLLKTGYYNWPLVGLIVMLLISIVFSRDRDASSQALIRIIPFWVSYFLLILAINSKKGLHIAAWGFAIAAAIIALSASFEFVQSPTEFLQTRARVLAVTGQPNRTAHTIAVLLPFLLYLIHVSKSYRYLWAIMLPIAIFANFVTFSRGGLFALLIGIIVMYRRHLSRLFLLGLIFLSILLPVLTEVVSNVFSRVGSISGRGAIISAAIRTSFEYPFAGVGFGNFNNIYQFTQGIVPEELLQKVGPGEVQNISAHNLYTYVMAEMGLIAFVLLILFLYRVLRHLMEIESQSIDSMQDLWLIRAILASFAAFLVSRLTTTNFSELITWVVFAVTISCLAVFSEYIVTPEKRHIVRRRRLKGQVP